MRGREKAEGTDDGRKQFENTDTQLLEQRYIAISMVLMMIEGIIKGGGMQRGLLGRADVHVHTDRLKGNQTEAGRENPLDRQTLHPLLSQEPAKPAQSC